MMIGCMCINSFMENSLIVSMSLEVDFFLKITIFIVDICQFFEI